MLGGHAGYEGQTVNYLKYLICGALIGTAAGFAIPYSFADDAHRDLRLDILLVIGSPVFGAVIGIVLGYVTAEFIRRIREQDQK